MVAQYSFDILPTDKSRGFPWLSSAVSAYTVGGSLLVRTVTGELHKDGVTQVTKICGYTLTDEEILPLDEAEIFAACNTDDSTGDLLAPEQAVQYCAAWELE